MKLLEVRLLFEAPRAVDLFKQRGQRSYQQARCATSFACSHSFVRARRGPLDGQVNLADGVKRFFLPRSEVLRLRIIYIKIFYIGLKSKHLLFKQIK